MKITKNYNPGDCTTYTVRTEDNLIIANVGGVGDLELGALVSVNNFRPSRIHPAYRKMTDYTATILALLILRQCGLATYDDAGMLNILHSIIDGGTGGLSDANYGRIMFLRGE